MLAVSPASAPGRELGIRFDEGRGIRECQGLRAFFDLNEAEGRALHSGPGDQFPLLGRIEGGTSAPSPRRVWVDVTMTYDGWLRVRGREVDAVLTSLPEAEREVIENSAWMLGRDVSAEVFGSRGFTFPDHASRHALWSIDGRSLSDYGSLRDIVACDQYWVFGRWRLDGPQGLRSVWDLRNLPELSVWTPQTWRYPAREDRHRAMGDWLVETYSEEELSRAVQISRVGADFTMRYYISFWHGNPGPFFDIRIERGGQICGEEWQRDPSSGGIWSAEPDPRGAARHVHGRLAHHLEECGLRAAQVSAALEGFEPAFAQAAVWAEEDRRYILALIDAIVSEGQ